MRKIFLSLLVVMLAASAGWGAVKKDPVAKVTFLKGKALVYRAKWITLNKGTMLFAQDKIKTTANTKVEVTFKDKNVLRIADNTIVDIDKGPIGEKTGYSAKMKVGKTWTNAVSAFRTETPLVAATIKGTVYRTNVEESTASRVLVYKGEVEVGNQAPPAATDGEPYEVAEPEEISYEKWVEVVGELQQIYVTPDGKKEMSDIPEEDKSDDWVVWNEEMDSKIER